MVSTSWDAARSPRAGVSNQFNLVHGSDGSEAAEHEIGLFFPEGAGLLEWQTADAELHACEDSKPKAKAESSESSEAESSESSEAESSESSEAESSEAESSESSEAESS